FEAPAGLIRRLVPVGVEPDHWNGRTHVSLVALGMHRVRLHGWRVPGFSAHLQVNFRTYVRYRGEPGVWFIREFVPSRLLAAAAGGPTLSRVGRIGRQSQAQRWLFCTET